jgi:hypothetical protein
LSRGDFLELCKLALRVILQTSNQFLFGYEWDVIAPSICDPAIVGLYPA